MLFRSLKLQMKDFSPDGRKPSPLTLSARLGAGRTEPGRLDYRGTLGLAPLSAQGQVQAVHLPLHAFEPYFGQALNIELLRADASFRGQVRYADSPAGPRLAISGDTALEEFRANSVQTPVGTGTPAATAGAAGSLPISEELLSWKTLSVRGLEVALAPGTATTVNVRETALSDFFARVIINPAGRINLQDLVKPSTPGGTTRSAATATPAAPDPVINVGPISLVKGKVFFSDRFVKPNYSADLSELTGRLGAFSSVPPQGSPQLPQGSPQMAELELRGRAEGTAALEILGKLNPLAKPLALDITGKVRDLELPPLSPYAVKYARSEERRVGKECRL